MSWGTMDKPWIVDAVKLDNPRPHTNQDHPRASLYTDLLANSAAQGSVLQQDSVLQRQRRPWAARSSAHWALGTPCGQGWPHPPTPGSLVLEALMPNRAWHVSLAQHGGVDSVHMWWLGRCGDALPCAQPRVSHRFRTSQQQSDRGAPKRGVGIFTYIHAV